MPRVVYTGFEVTRSFRKFFQLGLGRKCDWFDKYPEMDREIYINKSLVELFGKLRSRAPEEVRRNLENPYMITDLYPNRYQEIHLFLPTATHVYQKGVAFKEPSEQDLAEIKRFIDAANSVLPEATRELGAFKIEDMTFQTRFLTDLDEPVYTRQERKELYPPRHLRAFLKAHNLKFQPPPIWCVGEESDDEESEDEEREDEEREVEEREVEEREVEEREVEEREENDEVEEASAK